MHFNRVRSNAHFENKNTLLILLIIISAVLASIFGAKNEYNFWLNLNDILINPFGNLLVLSAFLINARIFINNKIKFFLFQRYKSYTNYLKQNIKNLIIINTYVYLSYIIISFCFSIVFSFGSIALPTYEGYGTSFLVYLIIFYIRGYFITCILTTIYYLFLEKSNIFVEIIAFLLLIIFFIIPHVENVKIGQIYLLYPSYFLNGIYTSYITEVVYSFAYIIALYLIYKIIFVLLTRKKSDII